MAYLGNDLQVAFPSYRNIDDISGSFNGVTTSFPLTVDGVAPIPAPINSQQCLISVNGVVQRPDDSGTEGFRLSGGNIIFASAPAGGVDFFGVILAGADYVNVGANFPSGSAAAPSITFDSDLDTGIYNPAGNQIGFSTAGTQRLVINSSGQISSGLGTAAAPAFSFISDPNTGVYSPGADQLALSTNGTGRLFISSAGLVGVGTSTPHVNLHVHSTSDNAALEITRGAVGSEYGYALYGSAGPTDAALRFFTVENGIGTGEKMRLDSLGRLGIGTSSPGAPLNVRFDNAGLTTIALFENQRSVGGSPDAAQIVVGSRTYNHTVIRQNSDQGTNAIGGTLDTVIANTYGSPGAKLILATQSTARLTVDASGNVGIGTTPSALLHVSGDDFVTITRNSKNLNINANYSGGNDKAQIQTDTGMSLAFATNGDNERGRFDASGRLLIGTSSAPTVGVPASATFVVQGYAGVPTGDSLISLQRGQAPASISSGAQLGAISFGANDGSPYAQIHAATDGAGGTNDYPGRLVFSTTADGASSPTERVRIPNGGGLSVGTTVSPVAVNQQTAIRIGALNVSQTTISNLTTTWTDITAAAGANGLAFVDIYNTSAGTQGNFLVSWRGYPANATVISSNNGTGLTINFQVVSGKLQMQTTSGTVSGAAFVWAG